jgi:hypothetical protein
MIEVEDIHERVLEIPEKKEEEKPIKRDDPIFDNLVILSNLSNKQEVEVEVVTQYLKTESMDREDILKKSIFEKIQFITQHSSGEKFLSSSHLKSVYSIVINNLCVRAMKKESFGNEKDSLILFGPEKGMKCLSFTFQIKDKFLSKPRFFCITIMNSNIEYLVYSWSFIEKNIISFVSEIEKKSKFTTSDKMESNPKFKSNKSLDEIIDMSVWNDIFNIQGLF